MCSKLLVVNELLAFIQNAIETMNEVSIVQICKSNFKEEEIKNGKHLLFQTLGKLDQMPCRKDNAEGSIGDIITLLKATNPDELPAFVAKELHRLPPVTFNHLDFTGLQKEITLLKSGMAEMQCKWQVSEKTITELRDEIVLLRNVVNNSPNVSKINQPPVLRVTSIADDAPRPSTSEAAKKCPSLSAVKLSYAAIAATNKHFDKQMDNRIEGNPCQNQCGTAQNGPKHQLHPAVPITLLYVSRLQIATTAQDIIDYLFAKTKITMKVERLDSCFKTNFNSFVVSVPNHMLTTCMREEFWPKGVVFRRFRGRLAEYRVY